MNFVFETIEDYNNFVKSSSVCFLSSFCNFICYDNTLEKFKNKYIMEKNLSEDSLSNDNYYSDNAYIILKSQYIFNPEFTKDYKLIKLVYSIFKKQLRKTLINCKTENDLIDKKLIIDKLFKCIYKNYIQIEINQFKDNNNYFNYAKKLFDDYYYNIINNFINLKLNDIYIDILDIYNTYYLANMKI